MYRIMFVTFYTDVCIAILVNVQIVIILETVMWYAVYLLKFFAIFEVLFQVWRKALFQM